MDYNRLNGSHSPYKRLTVPSLGDVLMGIFICNLETALRLETRIGGQLVALCTINRRGFYSDRNFRSSNLSPISHCVLACISSRRKSGFKHRYGTRLRLFDRQPSHGNGTGSISNKLRAWECCFEYKFGNGACLAKRTLIITSSCRPVFGFCH